MEMGEPVLGVIGVVGLCAGCLHTSRKKRRLWYPHATARKKAARPIINPIVTTVPFEPVERRPHRA
jgi:hypothetical protein